MTQTNLLEKRKKSLEQKKNRLKQLEASLNDLTRKIRTRRLIEGGGLLAKAHLEDWNANTLLGGLLFLKEQESNKVQMDAWTLTGGAAFSAEKAAPPREGKVQREPPVIVKFDSKPDDSTRQTLKSLNLQWIP